MSTQIAWTNGAAVVTLVLDAAVTFGETNTAQVTEHPIESGGVVSDNVLLRPLAVRLEGVVTETPLPAGDSSYAQDYFDDPLITIDARVGTEPDPTRSRTAIDQLRLMFSSRTTIDVTTGIAPAGQTNVWTDVYPDMVIESLEFPRAADTGDAVRFTAALKQVTIVDSQTAAIPNVKNGKTGKKSKGLQGTITATPPDPKRSIVVSIRNWATELVKGIFAPKPVPPVEPAAPVSAG